MIIELSFLHYAWIVGLLASVACGVIGAYVVVKRISFISGSIAHAAFGGIGLSYFLGIAPLLGATAFGLISAMVMGAIRYRYQQQEDTLIGAIWAVGMALGLLFIHLSSGYASDLFGYLFGNLLLSTAKETGMILGLNALILTVVIRFFRGFQAITFDEEYAKVLNLPVFALYLGLLALIALTTVILIRVVGVILVIALLTLPAATAKNFTTNLKHLQIAAVLIGMSATSLGLWLSYIFNLPTGPLIILVTAFLYVGSFFLKPR